MSKYEDLIVSQQVVLEQEEDCCGRENEEYQYMTLETHDGGGGAYVVMKTDRWAIDVNDIDSFVEIVKKLVASVKVMYPDD